MAEIEKLSLDERIFLAGCIKTMIMADGNISESELSDIDDLFRMEGFEDFDECLEEFEKQVISYEDFWELAAEITSSRSRDIILKHLDEVSIQDGFPDMAEKKFLNQLIECWKE
jgi:uncharacterized tellurite resistance protein B-like protein